MVWQDTTISIINLLLSYALIPQIYNGFQKKKGFVTLQTSIISSAGLYILAFTVFTLKLYFSAITTFLVATFWTILLTQKIIYR